MLGLPRAMQESQLRLPQDIVPLSHPEPPRLLCSPGKHGLCVLFNALGTAIMQARLASRPQQPKEHSTPAFPTIIRDPDTIPLPSRTQWRHHQQRECDLRLIIQSLASGTPLTPSDISSPELQREFRRKRFAVHENLLVHFQASTRFPCQIAARVVPRSLRRLAIVACHVSPMAGHSDLHKTVKRIVARFWWPNMTADITALVNACAHCKLANSVSHEAQAILRTLAADVPFDVVFLDVWSPGDIAGKHGACKILTCIEAMSGFAGAAPLSKEATSKDIAMAAFMHFLIPHGLPRLVVVDPDSLFKGKFELLLNILSIKQHTVAPKNHKAIRNERLHRFLNKVQKIFSADKATFQEWLQAVMFAICTWNASPADGTDISRSFCAISREFPFPIDINHDAPAVANQPGQAALEHVEAHTPWLVLNRQLLKLLQEERRQHHRKLKNLGKNKGLSKLETSSWSAARCSPTPTKASRGSWCSTPEPLSHCRQSW